MRDFVRAWKRKARWFRLPDGKITLMEGTEGKCLTAQLIARGEFPFSRRAFIAAYRDCRDRHDDDTRWTYTSLGQLRIYSDYYLTAPNLNEAAFPYLELCANPVRGNQRWDTNL